MIPLEMEGVEPMPATGSTGSIDTLVKRRTSGVRAAAHRHSVSPTVMLAQVSLEGNASWKGHDGGQL